MPPMVTVVRSFLSIRPEVQHAMQSLHSSQYFSSGGSGSVGSSSAVVTTVPRTTAAPWVLGDDVPESPNQPMPERTAR